MNNRKSTSQPESRQVAARVLREAAGHEHFFAISDAERLIWMLERAFEHGVSAASARSDPKPMPSSKATLTTATQILAPST